MKRINIWHSGTKTHLQEKIKTFESKCRILTILSIFYFTFSATLYFCSATFNWLLRLTWLNNLQLSAVRKNTDYNNWNNAEYWPSIISLHLQETLRVTVVAEIKSRIFYFQRCILGLVLTLMVQNADSV